MADFLETARLAIKSGIRSVIRTSDDLSYLLLAPDYPLVRWRNDEEVDRDMRRFFKTLINLKGTKDADRRNVSADGAWS